MGDVLISVIIALFFLGKITKGEKEKMFAASGWRIIVYLLLTMVIGTIYYKTCQVASIYNLVQIDSYKSNYDSTNAVTAKIGEIHIQNSFSSMGIYKDDFTEQLKKHDPQIKEYYENGGLKLDITSENNPSTLKYNPNKLSVVDIDALAPKKIDEYHHFYQISLVANTTPSFFPFVPHIDQHSDYKFLGDDSLVFVKTRMQCPSDIKLKAPIKKDRHYFLNQGKEDMDTIPINIKNGYIFSQLIGTTNLGKTNCKTITNEVVNVSEVINSMNFFTACDLTQFAYSIHIQSDLPVDSVYIEYNMPIETKQLADSMIVGSRGITVRGKILRAMMNDTVIMHIKLPTLENLQLIRSLILTTLLTAVVALLFSNIYFVCSRYLSKKRKKGLLPYKVVKHMSMKRVLFYTGCLHSTIFIICVIVVYCGIRLLIDKPIVFSEDLVWYNMFLVILIILFVIFILLRIKKYAYTPLSNDESQNASSSDAEVVIEDDEEEETPIDF